MQGDTLITMLSRLIESSPNGLSPAAAQAVLELRFSESDHQRIQELAEKSNSGTLTAEEATEYDNYITAGDWLALWKAKARLMLRQKPSAA